MSRGVCTISSTSNGLRQDWLVCPFRALDTNLLEDAARRLFHVPESTELVLVPVPNLAEPDTLESFKAALSGGAVGVAYFQSKLGGEISVGATPRSPELNFDATMVLMNLEAGRLIASSYAIFEIQTMDFHGTYKKAVENLSAANHLHKNDFASTLMAHPEWLSEGVEGPNISNAFKRTFYQMMFKFQIGAHGQSAGCVLAIPEAVWDSWQRFLGKPDLTPMADGTFRLLGSPSNEPVPAWIYVFDLDPESGSTPDPVRLKKVIGTTAAALSHFALDVAPEAALAAGGNVDRLMDTIRGRLGRFVPELNEA
ncbi:restriction endonuclease NotI [Frondihabitans australicus]|uniref:Restriction endonuclease NotI n=1 Tax=Frondihabitans australicus TaxID=386892 RepID=A0A495IIV0_9MICO|nr:restriction endonuclease NotI [Frondihabitans australicus]